MKPPASRPCGSCPYRRDVPSGVWAVEEYVKLPDYDRETGEQSPTVFHCHQQDGRICAGWAGCHDMRENLGLRLVAAMGLLAPEEIGAVFNYETDVPLWGSGAEAAAHGLAAVRDPDADARRVIEKLTQRLGSE